MHCAVEDLCVFYAINCREERLGDAQKLSSTLLSVIASIDISLHALSLLTHRDKSHLSKKGGRAAMSEP